MMPQGKENYSYWQSFGRGLLAGGGAGGSSLVFVYPLDLARTRMSTDIGKGKDKLYNGLVDCIKKTWKEGGIFALYKGAGISLLGIIPYRAVYFAGYDALKKIFLKDEKKSSFWFKWLISQTNTIFAQTLTYPIDTIRRVQMLAGKVGKDGVKNPEFKNFVDAGKWVYKNRGGLRGFFKGALANTYRATGAALCMVFYDTIKTKLDFGKDVKIADSA
jgi:solute carrier family 25 (adenine nucleotide translocator) protein 4/5/6/31